MATLSRPTRDQTERDYRRLEQAADHYARAIYLLATHARSKPQTVSARWNEHDKWLMRQCSEKRHSLFQAAEGSLPRALASALWLQTGRVLGSQDKLKNTRAKLQQQAHAPWNVQGQEELAKAIAQDEDNLAAHLKAQAVLLEHYIPARDVEVINGALNGNGAGTGPLIFHNRAVEFS